jgi:hypothetical protein
LGRSQLSLDCPGLFPPPVKLIILVGISEKEVGCAPRYSHSYCCWYLPYRSRLNLLTQCVPCSRWWQQLRAHHRGRLISASCDPHVAVTHQGDQNLEWAEASPDSNLGVYHAARALVAGCPRRSSRRSSLSSGSDYAARGFFSFSSASARYQSSWSEPVGHPR